MLTKDSKILIVGLGLIGGSYARALTDAGYEVGAVVHRQQTLDFALQHAYIRHGSTAVEADYVGQFDIVVFALYPHIFIDWIQKYQGFLKSGALITDVTGVKGTVVPAVQSILREDVEFVPAHPMAGREVYGVENSDPGIFKGANFIITPTEKNTPEGIRTIRALAGVLGFRNISEISIEAHDEMIGFLSQLTHCIAVSLMNCKESRHLVEYTGDSFRDLTRIAHINEDMWSELFIDNKAELLSQMDLFAGKFGELRDALAREDVDTMKEMMRISTLRRSYFDKKK